GPSETDDAGKSLETFNSNTGFIVGVTLAFPFTKEFGVRGELLYGTNGGRKIFESESAYQTFRTVDNVAETVIGYKRQNINVFNSYIQLPLTVYYKFFRKIELSTGICPSFLVSSTGTGELKQIIKTSNTLPDGTLIQDLEHNYFSDDIGTKLGDPVKFNLNSEEIATRTKLSAYEEYPAKNGNLYNSFDMGILAGVAYYFNSSLFVGARLYIGLNDVTNNNLDISLNKLNNNKLIYRTDIDKNFDYQFMVGFQF
ncbi:MAG TPA: outer membrane beta-barrel protein, partial [Saprospiraceae bacterium]|nr:outer membrane beta-barrel protein [Saprospiraceae bacterium]